MKKIFCGALLLVALITTGPALVARAETSDSATIAQLQAIIRTLLAQLAALQAQMNVSSSGAPVIESVAGPTSLAVGESGQWKLNVTAPAGANLRYAVKWGDTNIAPSADLAAAIVNQAATFSHAYAAPGTYTVIFTVYNDSVYSPNGSPKDTVTLTVKVGSVSPTNSVVVYPQSSKLTLKYNVDGMDEGLVGQFVAEIKTGNAPVCFYGVSLQTSANHDRNIPYPKTTFNLGSVYPTTYPPFTKTKCNLSWGQVDGYKIEPNSRVRLDVWANYEPYRMFAGSYKASLARVTFDVNERYEPTRLWSNSVTIVGEKSPYITDVRPATAANGTIGMVYFRGERVNIATNRFVVNGTSNQIVRDGDSFIAMLNQPLSGGTYGAHVSSPYGNSNQVIVQSTAVPAPIYYPGFFLTTSKSFYGPTETVLLTIRRADNGEKPVDIKLDAVKGAYSDGLWETIAPRITVGSQPVTWQIPLRDWHVFTKGGNGDYMFVTCPSGYNCGDPAISEKYSNATGFVINGVITPVVRMPLENAGIYSPGTVTLDFTDARVSGPAEYSVSLIKDSEGSFGRPLADRLYCLAAAQGCTENITIPANLIAGNDYRLKVCGLYSNRCGISARFNIKPTVNQPVTVDLKINGSDSPEAVPFDSLQVVSWTSSNAQTCLATYYPVKLTDGTVWTDLVNNMPLTGSRKFYARNANWPSQNPLRLGIECWTASGQSAKDDITLWLGQSVTETRIELRSPTDTPKVAGNPLFIEWTASANANIAPDLQVILKLKKGNVETEFIKTDLAVTSVGSYTWQIPTTIAAGSDYQVIAKIYSPSTNQVYAVDSSQTFSIIAQ